MCPDQYADISDGARPMRGLHAIADDTSSAVLEIAAMVDKLNISLFGPVEAKLMKAVNQPNDSLTSKEEQILSRLINLRTELSGILSRM